MQSSHSNSRPSLAQELELAGRGAEPTTEPGTDPAATPAPEPSDAPRPKVRASYFARGDFKGESDWWAKQTATH